MAEGILAVHNWPDNSHLIRDVAALGYIGDEVLDTTYGYGTFWKLFKPKKLIASDINPEKSPVGYSVDVLDMPWPDQSFDTVVWDGPYKLNGTDQGEGERYGVDDGFTWQTRMWLLGAGAVQCALRVRVGGTLLVKCQDQVCSGKMRWQTDHVTQALVDAGYGDSFRKVDRFDMIGGRPQPAGRRQVHARHNASQLLVFRRERA